MISISTNKILTKDQINLMHGNDTYMKMLKNKITVDDFKIEDKLVDQLYEPLYHTQGFVYYEMSNTFGHGKLEILFESALDMENYRINLEVELGLDQISK